jgi:hypothetical protein
VPGRACDIVSPPARHAGSLRRRIEDLGEEPPSRAVVRHQGVELLPLIDEHQQAVGARLRPEHVRRHVTQGNGAFCKMPGQLGDLGQPVDARHLRLEERDESRGQAVQRAIGRHEGRDLPHPAGLRLAQAGDQPGAHHR